MSLFPYINFFTFGEAMIRFAPTNETDMHSSVPSALANYVRSVGGDELNVAVALARLNRSSTWVSILPKGHLGDVVLQSALNAGVDVSNVILRDNSEIGTFYVVPSEKRVHYQRSHSAWALQEKGIFDWYKLLSKGGNSWLHITGISPLTGENPLYNWKQCLECAIELGIPISMDLNHRKQLGSLSSLWRTTLLYGSRLHMITFSLDSLRGLAQLEGLQAPPEVSSETDELWISLMSELHKRLNGPRVSCCFKSRNSDGVQRRWSVIIDKNGICSTYDFPVYHKPKDEIGGGSAWAAGYIDGVFEMGHSFDQLRLVARRADLLAALCQETPGDHSIVTRDQLKQAETIFNQKPAVVDELSFIASLQKPNGTPSISTRYISHEDRLTTTFQKLKEAKLIALIRGKNASLSIKRGIELAEMGCKALEITMDTEDVFRVVKELKSKIPSDKCLIGIGTIMDLSHVDQISKLGIDFAVSPIHPKDFINTFHSLGIIAIPGSTTPNELWQTHQLGAKIIKLFPSQIWSPTAVKDMLSIGELGKLNLMATGGITPGTATSWLEAGVACITMGSKLAGNDIRLPANDPALQQAIDDWSKKGKQEASKVIQMINSFHRC